MNQERSTARTRPQIANTKLVPAKARKPAAPAEPAWTEVANFVLTFESRVRVEGTRENRITAHKMQDGGLTAEWRGTEQQAMCGWIGQHLGDWPAAMGDEFIEAADPGTPSAGGSSTSGEGKQPTARREALPEYRLQVTAVHPRALGAPDAPVHVVDTRAFDIEASIIAVPVNADAATHDAVPCAVDFFCRNTMTAEKFQLGSTVVVDVTGSEHQYKAVLRQVALAPGHYRVACIARLRSAVAPVACAQGPLLQVG